MFENNTEQPAQETELAQERERNQVLLKDFILSKGGRISFDQFMEYSLYDPQNGYYQKRARIGNSELGNDFETYAHNPLYARCVVRFGESDLSEEGSVFLEVAGGEGTFKKNVLQFLSDWGLKAKFLSVDISSKMIHLQNNIADNSTQASATKLPFGDASLHGIIFANELFDALPHRVFRIRTKFREMSDVREFQKIEELYYRLDENNKIVAEWSDPSSDTQEFWESNQRYLAEKGIFSYDFNDEKEVCFAPTATDVLHELIRVLKSGKIILVDYGGNLEEIIDDGGRFGGTYIRQYPRKNEVELEDLPEIVFENDITGNVNFSALIASVQEDGIKHELHQVSQLCKRQISDNDIRAQYANPATRQQWDTWYLDKRSPLKQKRSIKALVVTINRPAKKESKTDRVTQPVFVKLLQQIRLVLTSIN